MNDSAKQFFKDYFSFGNLNTSHVGEIKFCFFHLHVIYQGRSQDFLKGGSQRLLTRLSSRPPRPY